MDRAQLVIELFAPRISLIAVGIVLAVWYFYPIVFEQGWIREARVVHAEWSAAGGIEGERRIEESYYLAEVRRFGAAPALSDCVASGRRNGRNDRYGASPLPLPATHCDDPVGGREGERAGAFPSKRIMF